VVRAFRVVATAIKRRKPRRRLAPARELLFDVLDRRDCG
jgi:hypothetical protein